MTPVVSILMPVRNSERFLGECLKSILNQTYQNWELIAVNDHSTDQSGGILETFCKVDKRIKHFENSGSGIIDALTLAFERSSGTLITRMDSDDIMPESRLELMVPVALENQNAVITGLVEYFSDTRISDGYVSYQNWLNGINLSGRQWQNIYRECVIASPNWLTSRVVIKSVGGFKSLAYPEDYHLVFKWYESEMPIIVMPETTLLWREHPDRTSRTSSNYQQEAFFNLKIREFLRIDWNHEPILLWGSNPKTQLTKVILRKHAAPFISLTLNDYTKVVNYPNSQVLVGVFPDESDRLKIINYLNSYGFQEGINFWFL